MYKTHWPELLRDWTSFWNCYIPNSFMFVKNMNKFFLLVGTMCITKNTLKFISKYQPKQISNIIRIHSWTVSHLSLSIQVVYCRWLRKIKCCNMFWLDPTCFYFKPIVWCCGTKEHHRFSFVLTKWPCINYYLRFYFCATVIGEYSWFWITELCKYL